MKITCTFDTDTHKVVPIELLKAIDSLMKCKGRYHTEQNFNALKAAFTEYQAEPPYPADEGWISVDDRLPDREGYFDVFVRSPGESIYNGRQADVLYCDSRWQATLQYGQHVSHWMPLPPAPKGE